MQTAHTGSLTSLVLSKRHFLLADAEHCQLMLLGQSNLNTAGQYRDIVIVSDVCQNTIDSSSCRQSVLGSNSAKGLRSSRCRSKGARVFFKSQGAFPLRIYNQQRFYDLPRMLFPYTMGRIALISEDTLNRAGGRRLRYLGSDEQ